MTVEPLTALSLSNECTEFSYVIAFKYVPVAFLVSCTRFWWVIFLPDFKYFKCNISEKKYMQQICYSLNLLHRLVLALSSLHAAVK